MKQHKRLPLALLLVFALCIQILSFTSAAAALADPEPVFSASDMTFSSGTDAVALPQSAVTQLSGLSSGTIIVDFTPTAMSTANCLFSLSNSSVTDAYTHCLDFKRWLLIDEVALQNSSPIILDHRFRTRSIIQLEP